jgi:hypothetical protein
MLHLFSGSFWKCKVFLCSSCILNMIQTLSFLGSDKWRNMGSTLDLENKQEPTQWKHKGSPRPCKFHDHCDVTGSTAAWVHGTKVYSHWWIMQTLWKHHVAQTSQFEPWLFYVQCILEPEHFGYATHGSFGSFQVNKITAAYKSFILLCFTINK